MAQNCWEGLRTAVGVVAAVNRVVKAAAPIRRLDVAAMEVKPLLGDGVTERCCRWRCEKAQREEGRKAENINRSSILLLEDKKTVSCFSFDQLCC